MLQQSINLALCMCAHMCKCTCAPVFPYRYKMPFKELYILWLLSVCMTFLVDIAGSVLHLLRL